MVHLQETLNEERHTNLLVLPKSLTTHATACRLIILTGSRWCYPVYHDKMTVSVNDRSIHCAGKHIIYFTTHWSCILSHMYQELGIATYPPYLIRYNLGKQSASEKWPARTTKCSKTRGRGDHNAKKYCFTTPALNAETKVTINTNTYNK